MKHIHVPWTRGDSRWAIAAFAWGLAEGTLFFIIPDVLLSFSAVQRPRKSLVHLASIVLGALLAGQIMFAWASRDPEGAVHTVDQVPFVTEKVIARAEADYERVGIQRHARATSRTPYKTYAVVAPRHSSWWSFGMMTIPARAERLVVTWTMFAAFGILVRLKSVGSTAWVNATIIVFWVVVYAMLWLNP